MMYKFNKLLCDYDPPSKLLRITASFVILLFFPVFLSFANEKLEVDKTGEHPETVSMIGIQQGITITGKVSDTDGSPLPGASIVIKGTQQGTVTDVNGSYSLTVPDNNVTLMFSFMGYATQEIVVGDQRIINVPMAYHTQQIEEIIVVGYGTMRKSDVTGAVLSVNEQQLKERPVVNALEAMQGKAAGVDITNSWRPGELGDIRIRGERSLGGTSSNIGASNRPLYVIDGIPMMGRNNINSINTADIKSIDILKDASATAIYGSRGANGVILISTHTGETGRYSVNYNGSVMIQTLQDCQERYNAAEFINLRRWAYYYSDPYDPVTMKGYPRGDEPNYFNDQLLFAGDQYALNNVNLGWLESNIWDGSRVKTTDWTKYVVRTGINHNHTLSVRGGTERIKSSVSAGYFDQQGTSIGQAYKRYTLNASVIVNPLKWFEMGARVNGSWSSQEYGMDGSGDGGGFGGGTTSSVGNIYSAARRIFPYAIPFDINGDRIALPGGDQQVKTVVDEDQYTRNLREVLSVMSTFHAVVKLPVDGLSYRVEFGPGFRYRRNGNYADKLSAIRESAMNATSISEERDVTWTVNNLLFYNKTFGNHRVDVTLLQTASKAEQVSTSMGGVNQPIDAARWHNMGAMPLGTDLTWVGTGLGEEQLTSYMMRGVYSYNNRYVLTATGRWDGSSVLAPGHKWAFFPSVSLAWRLDQEEFLKNVAAVNSLKLRLGWGSVGNAAISAYSTIQDLNSGLYIYGDQTARVYFINDGMYQSPENWKTMPNPNLKWERTKGPNVGVDFSLFRSRVSGTIDAYLTKTQDLLLQSSLISVTGFKRSWANVGTVQNRGVELTLNTLNVKTQSGFLWETSFNVAWQKNKLLSHDRGNMDDPARELFLNQPLRPIYYLKYNGIWKKSDAEEMAKFNANNHNFKPGQIRPYDVNGDYVININDDRVIIGNSMPTWTGGIINTFGYKGIELLVNIYGRLNFWTTGGEVGNAGRIPSRKTNYYTENNENARYQRPEFTIGSGELDPYALTLSPSRASFVNVRNISLSYNFPKNMVKNWGGMQNLRVYAQIINPFALYAECDFKFMDTNSATWNRNFVFGVNVGF